MLSDVRFAARWAQSAVETEFPFQEPIVFLGPESVAVPRTRHPVFYGAYDWHSCVHSFWSLLRFHRIAGTLVPPSAELQECFRKRFREEALAHEAAFLRAHPLFERPYGRAWFLALDAELVHLHALSDVVDPGARDAVRAGAIEVAHGMTHWLRQLAGPDRTGWHTQTAFALGLMIDWARDVNEPALAAAIEDQARRLFGADGLYAIHLEPAGEDFLSPSLAAADVMRRVLSPDDFRLWLAGTLPELASGRLPPRFEPRAVGIVNADDGRLAHHAGLGFSRAWMLAGIGRALADSGTLDDSEGGSKTLNTARETFAASVDLVRNASPTFTVTHWVGSFAIYAATHAAFTSSNRCGKFARM